MGQAMSRLGALLVVLASLASPELAAQTTVKYVHTDALGSVVAMTNSSGAVVETTREYEPYGQQLTPTIQDGPGYTGHVQDAATGLTYMQQRYYDPQLGVFLSVDSVAAYSSPVGQFHRYRYANNNPYKFTDPDGRRSEVRDGKIHITPEDPTVPTPAPIPNTVNAAGVSPSDKYFHTYDVATSSSLTPQQASEGFRTNPTPGNDRPASPDGTVNNVGGIPTAGSPNFVRSFLVPSPDPEKFTDITINYTVTGGHGLAEGFVMRYGEITESGTILRSYGEGNAGRQRPSWKSVYGYGWGAAVDRVWTQNHNEIIRNATTP